MRRLLFPAAIATAWVAGGALASAAWTCSVCFGAGDPDASGFAWGVLILLIPVAIVQVALFRFLLRAVRREGASVRRRAGGSSSAGSAHGGVVR